MRSANRSPCRAATFTFVTDGIESALRHARSAAAARDILVMGADVAQQYLKAGLVDEIIIQLVPILMGAGTRLFDRTGGDRAIELIPTRTIQSPSVTHLSFKLQ